MSHLEQVQRGIDFVERNLEVDLDLADVSRAAGMSHWHFQRIFRALTGETLKTYVRSRRMANALQRLLQSRTRILDIALEAGFESQESFTRAFKAAFGMTPGAYRKIGDKSLFLQKVAFDAAYLEHINDNVSPEPRIVERPAMQLVGLRMLTFGPEYAKNNIGAELPTLWGAFLERMHEVEDRKARSDCYGVVRPASPGSEQLEYDAAIEVDGRAPPPEGMSVVRIPAGTYACFEHRGPMKNLDHTVNFIYSTWLARSEHRHTYGPDLEIYGARYHPTSEDSVVEYAVPIGA